MILSHEKICKKCTERKLLAAYPKVSRDSDRRGTICSVCMYAAQKERELKNKNADEARILKSRKCAIPTVQQQWYSALEYAA